MQETDSPYGTIPLETRTGDLEIKPGTIAATNYELSSLSRARPLLFYLEIYERYNRDYNIILTHVTVFIWSNFGTCGRNWYDSVHISICF